MSVAKNDSLKNLITNAIEIRRKTGKGKEAYNFTVSDRNGTKHQLSDYKGKYVLIDVWATWCKPCRSEISFLQKLEEDYSGKPIVF
jgi:thiol-disulfide isomerase/thioredoxin